jgi:hypothetical protein
MVGLIGRRRPYTDAGVRRLKCVRCPRRAHATWQICSDGNLHRPLCVECDIELNRMVLAWVKHPLAKQLGDAYEARQRAAEGQR